MAATPFAVIDLETTGFANTDRIVEIGVVLMDADGNITGTWETLIQPNRDIPNTFVHGIAPSDVVGAPTFAEVGADLAEVLNGRTLVAHNAPFDIRFLAKEFARLGMPFPTQGPTALDTQRLASRILPNQPKTLSDCLAAVGLENTRPHAALSDAYATAELLQKLLQLADHVAINRAPLELHTFGIERHEWTRVRRGAPAVSTEGWMAKLADALPNTGESDWDEYRHLLKISLADHELSASEIDQLLSKAAELGISREDALEIHVDFIRQLAIEAWMDGVITDEERGGLHKAATELGVAEEEVESFLAAPVHGDADAQVRLKLGDTVTFTGQLELPRDEWTARARAAGLEVGGTSKRTAVVVAANVDSRSGKARRARELNIPIVSEPAFARMLRTLVDDLDTSAADLSALATPNVDAFTPTGDTLYKHESDDNKLLVRIFPWLLHVEGDSSSVKEITTAWLNSHAHKPLHTMSPVLVAEGEPIFFDNGKRVFQNWMIRYSNPLAASANDLMDLNGVGQKRRRELVSYVVMEAMDSDVDIDSIPEVDPAGTGSASGGAVSGVAGTYSGQAHPNLTPKSTGPVLTYEPVKVVDNLGVIAGWWGLRGGEFPEFADSPAPLRQALAEVTAAPQLEDPTRTLILAAFDELDKVLATDDRYSTIFLERIVGGSTLDEVGQRFNVTRERVRQLEVGLREKLSTGIPLMELVIDGIAKRALPLSDVSSLISEIPVLGEPHPTLAKSYGILATALSDKWILDGPWLVAPGLDQHIQQTCEVQADKYGVCSLVDVAPIVGLTPEQLTARIAHVDKLNYLLLGDKILTKAGSHQDRAAAVLSIKGEPMQTSEIAEVLGTVNERSLTNQLYTDDRMHKSSAVHWSLSEWGHERYESISSWIGERVDSCDPEVGYPLADLLAEASKIQVAESSVKIYANNGEFIVEDGMVKRGTEDVLIEADIQDAKNAYFFNGCWNLLVTVNFDHLRGSGFMIPNGFATMYGMKLLEKVELESRLGAQNLTVGRAKNTQLGSIKRFLDEVGAKGGDRVWLKFGEDKTFDVFPAPAVNPEAQDTEFVLNQMGIEWVDPADTDTVLKRINSFLNLDEGAPRRRAVAVFNHRNQEDLAGAVKAI